MVETFFRVDTRNQWIHVYSSSDVTLKFLHQKRGKVAIIHDCRHGLCGSHLLRELAFIVDTHGYAWARNMKRVYYRKLAKKSLKARKSD